MIFHSVDEALCALADPSVSPTIHQEALHFLASLDDGCEAENLVRSLQSDELGIRWEAANLLSKMGIKSIPAVLRALMDPERVCHPRLREGVVHMIHNIQDSDLKKRLAPLLKAIKGPAADIETMRVAYQLFKDIDPHGLFKKNEDNA